MKKISELEDTTIELHLNNYLQNETIHKVLSGKTTFEKEVTSFYGIHPYYRSARGVPPARKNDLDRLENEKLNQKPNDLIDIININDLVFEKTNRLSYSDVREDYKWFKKKTPKNWLEVTAFTGTFLFIFPVGIYAWAGVVGGNLDFNIDLANLAYNSYVDLLKHAEPEIGIPLTAGLMYAHIKLLLKGQSKHPNDQGGYDQFNQLWDASKELDTYIKKDDSYRQKWIQKELDQLSHK